MDYLSRFRPSGEVPAKKTRVWLGRCITEAKIVDELWSGQSVPKGYNKGRRKRTSAQDRLPDRLATRKRMNMGPPFQCPQIGEVLWDWFVDMRRSLASIITPKFVLLKARQIADAIVAAMKKSGIFVEVPVIDEGWVRRWRLEHGVVFRRPNCRYKVSKAKLHERMRALWKNVIRIRRLAERCFGNDLASSLYGIDEKPIHFNEAGSKGIGTLEICGQCSVKLKHNHSASRERASVMTCVTSNRPLATSARKPPICILFKAKTAKGIDKLRNSLPKETNFSLMHSAKGSFRKEDILAYLVTWLDPWTEQRAKDNDYRLIFLDAARSHLGDDVEACAWARGYCTMWIYGGTTGVAQVNDTDCHMQFERTYLEFEQQAFTENQMLDPSDISRTPRDVIADTNATWRSIDHERSVRGFLHTGLSNALDGTQDEYICREALECWQEIDMHKERKDSIREVDERFDAGNLCFSDWRSLMVNPLEIGVMEEGEEFEGEMVEGEKPWLEEGETEKALALEDATGFAPEPVVIHGEPGDNAEELVEAEVAARRLAQLERIRASSYDLKEPTIQHRAEVVLSRLKRGRVGTNKKANAILRRHAVEAQQKETANVAAGRAKVRQEKRNRAKVAALIADERRAKAKKKEATKALDDKIDALPKTFSAAEVGAKTLAGIKAREDCLEKLKLRSPKLSLADEVKWQNTKAAWAKVFPIHEPLGVGEVFIKKINEVLEKLGKHYSGPTKFNKTDGDYGDQSPQHSAVK